MDDLTRYVYFNYGSLLTLQEKNAFRLILERVKAQSPASVSLEDIMRWILVSERVDVQEFLRGEPEAFMVGASERVLREHAREIVLNHCPRCGSLARTPQAKQCPNCFFDWHGAV